MIWERTISTLGGFVCLSVIFARVGMGRNGTYRDTAFVKISSWDVMLVYLLTPLLVEIEVKGRISRRTRRGDDVDVVD